MLAGQGLSSSNGSAANGSQLPEPFNAAFRSSALAGELPVAWVQTDLDAELRFTNALVLLTNRRLLSLPTADGSPQSPKQLEWTVAPTLSVIAHVHAGLGSLELFEG